MDGLIPVGLEIVAWFQWTLGSWLQAPMRFFSFMGEEMFFLVLVPLIYWSVDTTLGIRMGIMLLTSQSLSHFFKLIFHTPRPFWVSGNINTGQLLFEDSFGLPSGHALTATSVWGALALSVKKVWLWIVVVVLVLLIGISRMYFGVHFPQDIVAGLIFGALLLVTYFLLEKPVKNWVTKQTRLVQILSAFGFSLVMIALVVTAQLILTGSGYEVLNSWKTQASNFFPNEDPINPLQLAGVFANAGTLFGLFLGLILNPLWGGFWAGGEVWMRFMRFLFGITGLLLIYFGLRSIINALVPVDEIWYAYIIKYLQYGIIGFWVTGGAVWLFKILGFIDQKGIEKSKKKTHKAKKSYAG